MTRINPATDKPIKLQDTITTSPPESTFFPKSKAAQTQQTTGTKTTLINNLNIRRLHNSKYDGWFSGRLSKEQKKKLENVWTLLHNEFNEISKLIKDSNANLEQLKQRYFTLTQRHENFVLNATGLPSKKLMQLGDFSTAIEDPQFIVAELEAPASKL